MNTSVSEEYTSSFFSVGVSRTRVWSRYIYFYSWVYSHNEPGLPHCWDFEITLTHTALGSSPLDERSARRKDLYLKRHKTVKRQTSNPPAGWDRQSLCIGRMKTGDLPDLREKQRRQNVCGADTAILPMMFLFMIHILCSAPHLCMTSSSWQNRIKFEPWVK